MGQAHGNTIEARRALKADFRKPTLTGSSVSNLQPISDLPDRVGLRAGDRQRMGLHRSIGDGSNGHVGASTAGSLGQAPGSKAKSNRIGRRRSGHWQPRCSLSSAASRIRERTRQPKWHAVAEPCSTGATARSSRWGNSPAWEGFSQASPGLEIDCHDPAINSARNGTFHDRDRGFCACTKKKLHRHELRWWGVCLSITWCAP
jgi:hypothetical protein